MTGFSWRTLLDPRMRVLLLLGLASGIPFDLRGQTLQLRLSEANVDTAAIGTFSLVGLPYILKFLWAPFLDRFAPPGLRRLGRRRGWQAVLLVGLFGALALMAHASPVDDLVLLGIAGLVVAFFSATFDVVVDAYRTDVLDARERSFGAGLASGAYRGGMLLGGLATPWIAAFTDWTVAYLAMGACMLPAALASLVAPAEPPDLRPPATLVDAIEKPFRALLTHQAILGLIGLVFLYKLGDAFGSNLYSAFLYKGVGFTSTEIATTRKIVGAASTIVGMILGGLVIVRYGMWRALVAFGVLQAATNLIFVVQAGAGRDFTLLFVSLGAENLAGGLGSAAFVTFITALCDRRYSAFQYALLSAIAMVGTILIGPIAGRVADDIGWAGYFVISAVVALPGLALAVALRRPLERLDRPGPGIEETFG
ncbi:MAG: MFS transporter [Deltaproteobacteria bacterium]|nr:MFS transporter [Deltaproteobacteria bacterium]